MTAARWLLILAFWSAAACGGSVDLTPGPFTRERADGKIPVKTELIRQQVRAELSGMPEGEAEVARWQAIEADYHSCRLSSKKAARAAEEVFADCMANRGYVYMYPIDAEQLHNDIEFEMDKAHRERIAAERKAEEERVAAEKKRQEEQERIRRQKELDRDLMAAVQNGDAAEEARLIAEGANPALAEKEHKRIAVKRKAEEERLADEKKRQEEQERARRQKELNDALVVAVRSGDAKEEARLIVEGANPEVAKAERKRIADERKAEEERLAATKKRQEKVESTQRQKDLGYDLFRAISAGSRAFKFGGKVRTVNIDEVKRLINDGADINVRDRNFGETPLHIATGKGESEIVHILIKAGADVNARSNRGQTPLLTAIPTGLLLSRGRVNAEIVHALIKAGANVNAQDDFRRAPLHNAASSNEPEIADALIKAGANVNIKNRAGCTPLDFAQRHGSYSDIVRILREAGAKSSPEYTSLSCRL